jgi:hypothetical protein
MKFIQFLLICCCLFAACRNPTKRKDQIKRIDIADGGCMKGCPAVGISIDSSLTLKYYGGYKAKFQGYYAGKVTQGFWDSLNTKLEQIRFKKLDTSSFAELDGQSAEVAVYWNKQKRHFIRSIYEDPDSVSHVLIWIINSYKQVKLHKLTDTVKFETRYQFIMPPQPPKPKLDQVKFPPPKKRLVK